MPPPSPSHSISWRRLDWPGRDQARLFATEEGWRLQGLAEFEAPEGHARLAYVVQCDQQWRTRSAAVFGQVDDTPVTVRISADPDHHRWVLNGTDQPELSGCIDLDLSFSPATNLLPIRRLNLMIGASGTARAAWLRFPGFTLQRLEQVYTRLDQGLYRYETADGTFRTELKVDALGFVTHYPDQWEA